MLQIGPAHPREDHFDVHNRPARGVLGCDLPVGGACSGLARAARAGHFVMLRLHETGERIPLTIADMDASETAAIGPATSALTALPRQSAAPGPETVALVGNPNVGKSALFGALTGKYVTVSNYPGTTVEVTHGVATLAGRKRRVLDTPGANGLTPMSEDE